MKAYRFNQIILIGVVLLFIVQNRQTSEGTVKGLVTNAKNNPVEFATAVLLNSETSEIEKEVVCNENGEFVFDRISPGEYKLSIRMSGFNSIETENLVINSNNQTIEKTIILKEANQKIKEQTHCILHIYI